MEAHDLVFRRDATVPHLGVDALFNADRQGANALPGSRHSPSCGYSPNISRSLPRDTQMGLDASIDDAAGSTKGGDAPNNIANVHARRSYGGQRDQGEG
jgi:hypothetical protein